MKYVFFGIILEILGLVSFVETTRLLPKLKCVMFGSLVCVFIAYVHRMAPRTNLKRNLLSFFWLAAVGGGVFQVFGVFVYSGILKDTSVLSFDSLRTGLVVWLIIFGSQVVVYSGLNVFRKYLMTR